MLNPYMPFISKKFNYCSLRIMLHMCNLQNGINKKVSEMRIFLVMCCSLIKPHSIKMAYSISTVHIYYLKELLCSTTLFHSKCFDLVCLFDNVPVIIKCNMWFQHDGAHAHFKQAVCRYLNSFSMGIPQ